jgi:hypothetical protein
MAKNGMKKLISGICGYHFLQDQDCDGFVSENQDPFQKSSGTGPLFKQGLADGENWFEETH